MAKGAFHVEAELAVSIRKTLDNAEERMDSMFDDDSLCEEAARWEDFGYFIQNCREYLGHVDIGLPLALLDRADDCARKLGNLDKVFEGAGVATAGRVGRVLGAWHGLQSAMAASESTVPRPERKLPQRPPHPTCGIRQGRPENRSSSCLPCCPFLYGRSCFKKGCRPARHASSTGSLSTNFINTTECW